MKIVKWNDFLKIKHPVLFTKYEPCYCGPLQVLGNIFGGNDFVSLYLDPVSMMSDDDHELDSTDRLFGMHDDSNINVEIDTGNYMRNGYVGEDEMFVILSKDDVRSMINKLRETLRPMEDGDEQ